MDNEYLCKVRSVRCSSEIKTSCLTILASAPLLRSPMSTATSFASILVERVVLVESELGPAPETKRNHHSAFSSDIIILVLLSLNKFHNDTLPRKFAAESQSSNRFFQTPLVLYNSKVLCASIVYYQV